MKASRRRSAMQWKHKASSLLSFAWHQIRMGSRMTEKPGDFERFFGFVHVRSLAIWMAIFEGIYLVFQTVIVSKEILAPSSSNFSSTASFLHAFAVVLAFTAVILHVVGIVRRTPTLLIPHMLMQVLAILALFALSAFSLYALLVGTSVKIDVTLEGDLTSEGLESTTFSHFPRLPVPRLSVSKVSTLLIGILVLVTVFYASTAMFTIWCFHVVLDCYRWLIVRITEKAQNTQANGNRPPTIPVIVEPKINHIDQNLQGVVPSQV